jgi:hypothetical protein
VGTLLVLYVTLKLWACVCVYVHLQLENGQTSLHQTWHLIPWGQKYIPERSILLNIVLNSSPCEDGSCSSEIKHDIRTALGPNIFVSKRRFQEQRPHPGELSWARVSVRWILPAYSKRPVFTSVLSSKCVRCYIIEPVPGAIIMNPGEGHYHMWLVTQQFIRRAQCQITRRKLSACDQGRILSSDTNISYFYVTASLEANDRTVPKIGFFPRRFAIITYGSFAVRLSTEKSVQRS